MKNTTIAVFVALISGVVLTEAKAQITTHTQGDIYAGFWQMDASGAIAKNYAAKIGTQSSLTAAKQFDTLVNLGSDLDTMFGSGWYNNSGETNTVNWGVFGQVYSGFSNGETNVPYLLGVRSSYSDAGNIQTLNEYQGDSAANFSSFTGGYDNLAGGAGNGSTAGALTAGVNMTGDANSFAKFVYDSGFSLGAYGDLSTGVNIPGNDGDMYVWAGKIAADFGDANAGNFVNRLTVDQSGVVSVIPEPSTYAMVGVAALFLIVAYRRKVSA
jgi:hypothetical protein